MQLIDGKALAASVREEVARGAADFKERAGRAPVLAVVLAGEDPASKIYVRNKKRGCRAVGIGSQERLLPADTGEERLLDTVRALNEDPEVDGILVQLPLPEHIDADAMIEAICPDKDVDGFHPVNLGRLMAGRPGAVPCTPLGCMRMLASTGVPLSGARAVVVGRSIIVGKPMAALLLAAHATVTVCHTRTRDLAERVREAEILVAAAGRPGVIAGEWIREGAVVLDVGTNRLESGELVGDVEFEAAARRAAWISPVPGGVGPMTIACLLENTLTAARTRAGLGPTAPPGG